MGIHSGFLNSDSDSWENLAASRVSHNERNYFCTSTKCCTIFQPQNKFNAKLGKVVETFYSRRLNKVFKFKNKECRAQNCPDCGEPLIWKAAVK